MLITLGFPVTGLIYNRNFSNSWARLQNTPQFICISLNTVTMVPVAFYLILQRAPTCHVGVAGYSAIAPELVLRANYRQSSWCFGGGRGSPSWFKMTGGRSSEWCKMYLKKKHFNLFAIKRTVNLNKTSRQFPCAVETSQASSLSRQLRSLRIQSPVLLPRWTQQ